MFERLRRENRPSLRQAAPVRRATLRMAAALAGAALLGGCVLPSPEQINADVQAERKSAYQEWTRERAQHKGNEIRVDGPLSLEDAIKVALQYNKTLQSVVEDKAIAKADMISAYQIVLPSVAIVGSYTHLENTDNYVPRAVVNQYAAGFTVTQPLGQGERIPATLRRMRLFQALANESVRAAVQTVISDTATAYYDVVLAQELIKVNSAAMESAEAQLRVVRARRQSEVALEYEVLRAQVELSNTEVDLITQQNNSDVARTSLLKIMGVSQDSAVELTDPLEFFAMVPVFERAVEIAFGNRPDLATAEMNIRAQREALRIARSAWWPSFAATAGQNWSKPNQANGRDSWDHGAFEVGINATWLLNAADTIGQQRAEAARLRQQKIAMLDKQDRTLQEIRSAMYELVNSEKLVRAQALSQKAATESLRLADVGYQAGVTPDVEVVIARSGQTTAQGNYYQALYRHTRARLALQVAMGVLGPRPGQNTIPRELPAPPARFEEFMTTAPSADLPETAAALDRLLENATAAPASAQVTAEAETATAQVLPAPTTTEELRALVQAQVLPLSAEPVVISESAAAEPSAPAVEAAPVREWKTSAPDADAAALPSLASAGEGDRQLIPMTSAAVMAAATPVAVSIP